MSARTSVSLIGLIAGGNSGIPRYARALTEALDRVSPEFADLRLSLVTTEAGARAVRASNIVVRDFPLRGPRVNSGPGRMAVEQVLAATGRSDLLHFFDLNGPVLAPWRPFMTTIHDASVMHGLRSAQHSYKRRLWPWALRRARMAVAVSGFARDEAIRHLGGEAERIRVVYSGPGLMGARADGRNGGSGHEPYLLFVGNLTPSKNLPFLLRAFERAGAPTRLLLVGQPYQLPSGLREQIESATRRGRVEVVPDASDDDIDRLYRSATALLLPSRYEGFGFTPLEAMARDCPVLASDIPSLREISGTGAMLLPLDDEAGWAEAIRRIVADERLRGELRARGARTVARYSWEETARNLCRLFLEVGPR